MDGVHSSKTRTITQVSIESHWVQQQQQQQEQQQQHHPPKSKTASMSYCPGERLMDIIVLAVYLSQWFFDNNLLTPKPWKMKVLGPLYMGHNPQKWRFWVPLEYSIFWNIWFIQNYLHIMYKKPNTESFRWFFVQESSLFHPVAVPSAQIA